MDINLLTEEASRYALTSKLLNQILDDLKEAILANGNLIMNANKVDVNINKKQVKLIEFINIIDSYRNSECILNDDERMIVIYRGDPYLTLHLCLQSLTRKSKNIVNARRFSLWGK